VSLSGVPSGTRYSRNFATGGTSTDGPAGTTLTSAISGRGARCVWSCPI
jgi:hypothetical protein